MSDFLSRLVQRTLEPAKTVRPRTRSLFEPVPTSAPQMHVAPEHLDEIETSPSPVAPPNLRARPAREPGAEPLPSREERAEPARGEMRREGERAEIETVVRQPVIREERAPRFEPIVGRRATREAVSFADASVEEQPPPRRHGTRADALEGSDDDASPTRSAPSIEPVSPRVRRAEEAVLIARAPVVPVAPQPFASTPRNAEPAAPVRAFARRGVEPHEHPAASEPEIHVTIGRVEVRAVPAEPASSKPGHDRPRVMTLDEYLQRRAEGMR